MGDSRDFGSDLFSQPGKLYDHIGFKISNVDSYLHNTGFPEERSIDTIRRGEFLVDENFRTQASPAVPDPKNKTAGPVIELAQVGHGNQAVTTAR